MTVQLKDPTLWRQQAYIGGEWRNARSEATLDVINPASRQRLGSIPACDGADTPSGRP